LNAGKTLLKRPARRLTDTEYELFLRGEAPGTASIAETTNETRTSAESKLHEGDIVKESVRRVADDYGDAVRKDVEEHLARNPRLIGKGLKLADRQLILGGDQIDLLFEDRIGNLTVVAVKSDAIGRDALEQTQRHVHELKETAAGKTVKGVIVLYRRDARL